MYVIKIFSKRLNFWYYIHKGIHFNSYKIVFWKLTVALTWEKKRGYPE